MPRPMRILLVVLMASLAAVPVRAQSRPAPPLPPVPAIRLQGHVEIDGVLDEAVWKDHPPITQFFQLEPDQGDPARFRTEAWIAYDDEAIYVAARMTDPSPDSIVAQLVRRDQSVVADRFCVYFDPYHDKRSGYFFLVNAAGSVIDGTESNDGYEDSSWDGVWEGRAKRDATGWCVEMRVPFTQMRFQTADVQTWGFNLRRVVARYQEQDMLAYTPRGESGFVSRWPDLTEMRGVRPGGGLELLPYVTSKASYLQHPPDDPFNDGASYKPNAGGDLRMAVGPRLTLNATVNPDFGQVEVDPASINLSDVETFYQEKRPFFVENAQVFRFGNEGASDYWNFNWPEPMFFYSRRIGRAPQGAIPDSAEYVSPPEATTIISAAKLTGKITPTTNFGFLSALTGRETADLMGPSGGRAEVGVEPLTYYGVLRGQKEFKDRRQGLGVMGTYVQRSIEDPALESQLDRSALMGGLDGWVFLDPNKAWVVSGYSAFTHVTGTPERMVALQSNSRHYYQRPDVDYLGVDSSATSLDGAVTRLWLNHEKGRLISNSGIGFITPGFDVNNLGFQGYADVVNAHTANGWKWTEVGKVKRFANTSVAAWGATDFNGTITGSGLFNTGYVQFVNYHEFNWNAGYGPPAMSARRTRGGPYMVTPAFANGNLFWESDPRQALSFDANVSVEVRPGANTQNWSVNPELMWRPRSNIHLSIGPGFERNIDDAQYITQVPDAAATATYGTYYVFAHLDQSTAYASIRLDWAFNPAMTLQLYAQPFVSVGKYSDYKSLAAPRTWSFEPYPDMDGDFNYRSLRGNAVFRWEYMPGSAFYLAWTQDRENVNDVTDRPFGSNLSDVVRMPPNDVFLAKVTYYIHM